MQISTMITKNSVTVNFESQTYTILSSDPSYSKMLEAIRAKDYESVRNLVSKAKMIVNTGQKTSDGNFEVRDGSVYIDGKEVHGELYKQIMYFMDEKLPFQPLVNFYRKLRKNPSYRVVNSLFSFLEKNKHPITESGNFIAYKRVKQPDSEGKMLDIHSGKFDNRPGNTLEMPRNEVNEDPQQTCSYGLHVANWDYAYNKFGSMSDAMLEVEVDPANVVAIPLDYNESKIRTCRYLVRSVVNEPNGSRHLVVDSTGETESSPSVSASESYTITAKQPVVNTKSNDEKVDDEDDSCEACGDPECYDGECIEEECDLCGETDCFGECQDDDDDLEDEEEEKNEDDFQHIRNSSEKDEILSNNDYLGSQPVVTPSPATNVAGIKLHNETTLRKMSTSALKNYQQRLSDSDCLNPAWLNERAKTFATIRQILSNRK